MTLTPAEHFGRDLDAARCSAPSDHRAEMRRLATSLRDLIHALSATTAPRSVLAVAAESVEAAAKVIAGYSRGFAFANMDMPNGQQFDGFLDHSPIGGLSNALAPPVTIAVSAGVVRGGVNFGSGYEGAPNWVHGGYIAAAFDEVLGVARAAQGGPASLTGRLQVQYLLPTPLHTDLVLESWLVSRDGRKAFIEGRLVCDGVTLAKAEATFIDVETKVLDRSRPATPGEPRTPR